MIVVSDTSPISNLLTIGQLELLPTLFQRVYVPVEVWRELAAFHDNLPSLDDSEWLEVYEIKAWSRNFVRTWMQENLLLLHLR